jgi:hypothetical protein
MISDFNIVSANFIKSGEIRISDLSQANLLRGYPERTSSIELR